MIFKVFLNNDSLGLTAALLDCVEKASSTTNTPTAMANISSSKPLDLAQFFNGRHFC